MFRAIISLIIRSILAVFTASGLFMYVVTGWCHGGVGTEF